MHKTHYLISNNYTKNVQRRGLAPSSHLTCVVYCTVCSMCSGDPQNILGLGALKVCVSVCSMRSQDSARRERMEQVLH